MQDLEGNQNAWASAAAYGFHEDAVAVVIVDNQHVLVSSAGRYDKPVGKIRTNLAGSGFDDGGVAGVGTRIAGIIGWKCIVGSCRCNITGN